MAQSSINTSSTVNPDRDILGTGVYHIQQDQLDLHVASIYSPAGAFLGTITVDRLHILNQAYQHPTSGTFAGAVASWLTRYKVSGPSEESRQTKMSNHWATPDELINQSINQLHLSSTMAGCVQGDRVFLSSKPLYPEPALPKMARS